MTQSMNSCFYDKCLPKIEYFLEQLENENDENIIAWYKDNEELSDKLVDEFNNESIYDDEKDCFDTINNKLKYFQEMIENLKSFDEEYAYDGDVIKMFNLYTYRFMRDSLCLDGAGVMDDTILCLIVERLEELYNKINSSDESEEEPLH